ncbi:hypothetical protein BDN70DRAFT_926080 [Pholiota conissans]|uniref:Uncharacterized protein n=1 Tax=Pholiota conissans TaxID=109636 RepID=A0A9P5YKQ4_9AGAR|nr:hypothetical protein BDN70DRAFT_926080 [Pholiota conissans]
MPPDNYPPRGQRRQRLQHRQSFSPRARTLIWHSKHSFNKLHRRLFRQSLVNKVSGRMYWKGLLHVWLLLANAVTRSSKDGLCEVWGVGGGSKDNQTMIIIVRAVENERKTNGVAHILASVHTRYFPRGCRWLHDEQQLRYQWFNVDALKNVVMSSTRARQVTDIRKSAEGRCNKVLHVQPTEGSQSIACIPTPLSGSPHLVTASEVATMDFLPNRLGLKQAPHVLSWSSRAENIPVGAEYIVMDVADGAELHLVWHKLTMKQKLQLVYQWIKIEWTLIGLPSKGCNLIAGPATFSFREKPWSAMEPSEFRQSLTGNIFLRLYVTSLIPRVIEEVEPAPGQAEEIFSKKKYLRRRRTTTWYGRGQKMRGRKSQELLFNPSWFSERNPALSQNGRKQRVPIDGDAQKLYGCLAKDIQRRIVGLMPLDSFFKEFLSVETNTTNMPASELEHAFDNVSQYKLKIGLQVMHMIRLLTEALNTAKHKRRCPGIRFVGSGTRREGKFGYTPDVSAYLDGTHERKSEPGLQ